MANPQITWTTPAAGLLSNDLYTITPKFGDDGTFAPGGDNASLSGEYSSDIYALARTADPGQSLIDNSDTDEMQSMFVVKRNGTKEEVSFDKVLRRIKLLSKNLTLCQRISKRS